MDLDLVSINAYKYTHFGQILSICSQDIERNYDGWNDGRTDRMTDNPNPV